MRQVTSTIFVVLSFLSVSVAFGQSFKASVDDVYNFSPAKLSDAEQKGKVSALDNFWNKVKSDTGLYLPKLRSELNAKGHNPYFYFDGSSLLLSLSKNDSDKQLSANATVNCDLIDIDRGQYVKKLNRLSNDGADVTNAALKILSDTSFRFFIPQHTLNFDQSLSLAYMLVPENPKLYVDSLIARFKKADTIAQKSILLTLWFSYTCKGDSLIKKAINDESVNKIIRRVAKEMMTEMTLDKETSDYVEKLSAAAAVELRKKSLGRFSDEALSELWLATVAIRKHSQCQ